MGRSLEPRRGSVVRASAWVGRWRCVRRGAVVAPAIVARRELRCASPGVPASATASP